MVVQDSMTFVKGTYRLPDKNQGEKGAAIVISGDHVVVDFQGATLEGTDPTVEPDQRIGTGILVTGNDVTIRNVAVRGYKLAIIGKSCKGLSIQNCNLSYNWKEHLKSTHLKENNDDWLSFHHNEKGEWLRYGAALYLDQCSDFKVSGVKATGGQCGIMLNQSDKGTLWNNSIRYMSGVGLGLYRSNSNVVMHNAFDYCVRGFSENVYNRGQDSAAILVYEQSSRNTFAYNSATHGGDGFFLWAGQSTMDSGEGGCNDNLLYGNDFSHAVINGIEATFSRNTFANNLVMDCWHGLWGGYGFESLVIGNLFRRNVDAIAWEHGQAVRVEGNTFDHDGTAIRVWGDPDVRKDWGYVSHRQTESRDWVVLGNIFQNHKSAIKVANTKGLVFSANSFSFSGVLFDLENVSEAQSRDNDESSNASPTTFRGDLGGNRFTYHGNVPVTDSPKTSIQDDLTTSLDDYRRLWLAPWNSGSDGSLPHAVNDAVRKRLVDVAPRPLPGGVSPFLPDNALRGRRSIHVDEWGPDDGRYPRIWRRAGETGATEVVFDITGPTGEWSLVETGGASVEGPKSGTMPATIKLRLVDGKVPSRIKLSFRGVKATDYRGVDIPGGTVIPFEYVDGALKPYQTN